LRRLHRRPRVKSIRERQLNSQEQTIGTVAEREKMPFEVTPFMPYLMRYGAEATKPVAQHDGSAGRPTGEAQQTNKRNRSYILFSKKKPSNFGGFLFPGAIPRNPLETHSPEWRLYTPQSGDWRPTIASHTSLGVDSSS